MHKRGTSLSILVTLLFRGVCKTDWIEWHRKYLTSKKNEHGVGVIDGVDRPRFNPGSSP